VIPGVDGAHIDAVRRGTASPTTRNQKKSKRMFQGIFEADHTVVKNESAERDWNWMPQREWTAATTQFAILFGVRFRSA